MTRFKRRRSPGLFCTGALLLLAGPAAAFPPLSTEISTEHPLFIFQHLAQNAVPSDVYAQQVLDAWTELPERLKPYAAIQVDAGVLDADQRQERYRALLRPLQQAGVPLVIRIADPDPRSRYRLDRLQELLRDFTTVKGVEASGLRFDVYDPLAGDGAGVPQNVRWLAGAIDVAARYGRFIHLPFDGVHWPRILANNACQSLYAKIRECRDYVVPAALHRGPHHILRLSALFGLWLEGGTSQWGIAADSRWYADAHFIEPGLFGVPSDTGKVPSSIYRAMILNGAMTGATVYAFSPGTDLWFGNARHHWAQAIAPTLEELLDHGLIARKDFVQKKTPFAYQLAPAATPADFHINLRDLDGVLDQGLLVHSAYGMERPGQVPELILNRGDLFWIPVLSAHASEDALALFTEVAQPGHHSSVDEWTALLDRFRKPAGQGSAFIAQVGRGIFVMNSRENVLEAQSFAVPAVPAPVRGIAARRENNTVSLSWPFREGDVSYSVHKRVLPQTAFMPAAEGLDQRQFDDVLEPDQTAAYSVTALTNEKEPFQGTVQYGEYLALSVVESRIAEEVLISPLLSAAESVPIPEPIIDPDREMPPLTPWWPDYTGLDDAQRVPARAIVERIEAWDRAFAAEDINGVLDLYSTEYEDPQGWRFQYIRRAYQWFFERYTALHMHRQIRRWDFSAYDTAGQVHLLLYCQLTGTALSDPAGRIADTPAAIPRTETAEVWITWSDREGVWRLLSTNPALPNFRDLLSYSAGPYDLFPLGPDQLSPR